MNARERRIARARLLRRDGKTYDEIRAVIGPVDAETLRTWLRGIPRPPATLRTRAKDDLRRECRRLRAEGLTVPEIAERTGASKGSVSPWVANVRPPATALARRSRLHKEARRRVADANRQRAADRRAAFRATATAQVEPVTWRDLFIAGVALYWAEGAKDKPWRRNGRVVLINSDPDVLALFLRWLDLLGVAEGNRTYRLSIHDNADVAANEQWWSDRLNVPLMSFAKATTKRHNPKTIRRNTNEHYHGCLVISVARSSRLYDSIEGWWRALANAAAEHGSGTLDTAEWSPVG